MEHRQWIIDDGAWMMEHESLADDERKIGFSQKLRSTE
jgi:hypothetical protein